jgi:hypothetical protein
MRLCTCGHRDARHDQLDGEVRGECMACSCPFFEDAKSSIEEEIAASTYRVPEMPALVGPDDQLFILSNVPVEPPPSSLARVLADHNVLELFEAWRCAQCGSRSWKQDRCAVFPECRGRWTEPVTVEIRRRSP